MAAEGLVVLWAHREAGAMPIVAVAPLEGDRANTLVDREVVDLVMLVGGLKDRNRQRVGAGR